MKVEVRDHGLLSSALARPQTTVFGKDAYADIDHKAAALFQSLVGNHPLVDGNKRLGLACTAVFLHMNGKPLTLGEHEAYELTMDLAAGELESLEDIVRRMRSAAPPDQR